MDQLLKKTEKEIRDLKFALDQSSIVAITDVAGTITYVNDKFCEISKYSREELMGRNHRILNSHFHPPEFFVELWQTISSGKVWKGEVKNRAKDQSFYWVFTTIVPFLNEKGLPYQYLAIRTDITSQKLAQERQEQSRAALLQSEKMASLGELAAGIAHELGNPIAIIRGRMEFLEMQLAREEVSREKILKISATVKDLIDRMTKIIRGMRSLARDGSKDPFERVSVARIIGDVIELSKENFSKRGITVHLNEINDAIEVACRETQISQVFVNLINNARDAIEDLPERWIKIDVLDLGDSVEIAVTDSGKGIPKEIQLRIMEPFFSTKEVGKGTGLGLSISRSILENHKGSLRIDDQSANTRFIVNLPKGQNLHQT